MPHTDAIVCSLQSCYKNITKTQGSINCILCAKWYHASCVNISAEQMTALAKARGIISFVCDNCKETRGSTDTQSFREELRKGLADIQQKFDKILFEVKDELGSKFAELKEEISNCNNMIKDVEESTTKKFSVIEAKNDILQKRMYRADILVTGLPRYQENIYEIIVKIGQVLKVEVQMSDVNFCYFINKGNTVLVKLNSIYKRDLIMRNYFKTRKLYLSSIVNTDINKRIYLNDHLTPNADYLMFHCRRLLKQKKFSKYHLINSDITRVKITFEDNNIKTFNIEEFCSIFNISNINQHGEDSSH